MASTSTKVGHGLAKALRIRVNERQAQEDALTRGESTFTTGSGDTFVEEEPSVIDWIKDLAPERSWYPRYVRNLFPFTKWIMRYNLQWLIGDLVAGITVGCVVVPQGMAYAKLAALPVEYGLYSSFMGVLIYWFFATSKDITIGPVAVMSTIVGNIVLDVQETHPDIEGHVVASALAVICGAIITFMGLTRIGFLVELIPLVAISAFMTGSAISIAAGQVPNLMGISSKLFNTRGPAYMVIINTLKHLPDSKLDAAMGLSALVMLYLVRFGCNFAAKKNPQRAKTFFFISTLRTAFVILLYTGISAGVNIHRRSDPAFAILKTVPRGFKHAAVPTINTEIISWFASELPASVIVLLIEHIAISKSFGRINNYTIDPSQELVAIGVTNLLGPFLGGYPATGSFSRTAIKSKAGVRTPFAGVITAVVVLLAIYALPAVFFYIPNSSLAAVIIHAVGDLITPPNTVYQFWRVAPIDVVIFFAGVFVTIFSGIENGIYTTCAVSAAVLLFRIIKANGHFVGRVKVHSVVGDHLIDPQEAQSLPGKDQTRNIFLPLDHNDGSNPDVRPEQPYPGVFIYRFSEGFNYPSANHYTDYLVDYVHAHTRRTNPDSWPRPGDRPWNNPGPRAGKTEPDRSHLPTLKAIILDFASVNNVDVTSIQNLIDVRNQLDRYAAPNVVQWHIASIKNRWTKRALAAGGFGYPTLPTEEYSRWKSIFSVSEIGGDSSAAAQAERATNKSLRRNSFAGHGHDVEHSAAHAHPAQPAKDAITIDTHSKNISEGQELNKALTSSKAYKKLAPVHGLNRPLFHIDITAALQAAIANVEAQYGIQDSSPQDPKRGVGTPSDSDSVDGRKEKDF